jgi:hypothetical protein
LPEIVFNSLEVIPALSPGKGSDSLGLEYPQNAPISINAHIKSGRYIVAYLSGSVEISAWNQECLHIRVCRFQVRAMSQIDNNPEMGSIRALLGSNRVADKHCAYPLLYLA